MRTATFIILFISGALKVNSQPVLTFLDSETNVPINGLVVKFSSDSTHQMLLSDSNGRVRVPSGKQYDIFCQHLSYEPFSIKVTGDSNQVFYLQPTSLQLAEVLITTGQYSPQSLKNSVYRVKTISKKEIQQSGAITLEEVLQTNLNSSMTYDPAIGNFTIGLQGLSSQNTKILLDGVPIAGRNGNGNDVDLGQIDLLQIDRIEIVEGPMAVNYGANALAGVINLISDKSNQSFIRISSQEESAANEYHYNAGKHIQRLGISHQLFQSVTAKYNLTRSDFQGFKGERNDRTYEWDPKKQWRGNGLLKYDGALHSIHYKTDWNYTNLYHNGIVRDNIQPSTGVNRPFAFDESYRSGRQMHQVQAEGNWPQKIHYTAVYSYSHFKRVKSRMVSDLLSGQQTLTNRAGDQDTSAFNAQLVRLTLAGKIFQNLKYQMGSSFNCERATGGRILSGSQAINEFSYFASAEFSTRSVSVRPGFRSSYNQQYGNTFLPSVNVKLQLPAEWTIRSAYGTGYRTPTLRELYFEFVDSNHRIFGNPSLKPESSNHFNAYIDKKVKWRSFQVLLSSGAFYNHINNQITTAQSPEDNSVTSFANVLKHQTIGYNTQLGWQDKLLKINLGWSYIGRYNQVTQKDSIGLNRFLFSPEITTHVNYTIEKPLLSIAINYKFNGKCPGFIQTPEAIEEVFTESYHWLNLTATKTFKNGISLQTGVKNLTNVQTTNNGGATGTHSNGTSSTISYGRSYFLHVSYQLNFKQNK